jgi:hypothetical protein
MSSHLSSRTFPVRRGTPEERVLCLLRAGVPLSLLLDLAGSDPHSQELYTRERPLPGTPLS